MSKTPVDEASDALAATFLEDIGARHRHERKELQARIQELKKKAPKNDKKKRKEAMETVAKMESDLELRHANELKQNASHLENTAIAAPDALRQAATTPHPAFANDDDENDDLPQQRVSKAQKRRDKKAQQARQLEEEIRVAAVNALTAPKAIETRKLKEKLKEQTLTIYEIPSDGNCLYNAVRHQLEQHGEGSYSVQRLRDDTAEYLSANRESCICYMPDLSEADFDKYCEEIRKTPAWGGQLELKALSSVYGVPIEVLQAEGPITLQGAEEKGHKLVITYHRHLYSLGEHYNSTVSSVGVEDEQSSGE